MTKLSDTYFFALSVVSLLGSLLRNRDTRIDQHIARPEKWMARPQPLAARRRSQPRFQRRIEQPIGRQLHAPPPGAGGRFMRQLQHELPHQIDHALPADSPAA